MPAPHTLPEFRWLVRSLHNPSNRMAPALRYRVCGNRRIHSTASGSRVDRGWSRGIGQALKARTPPVSSQNPRMNERTRRVYAPCRSRPITVSPRRRLTALIQSAPEPSRSRYPMEGSSIRYPTCGTVKISLGFLALSPSLRRRFRIIALTSWLSPSYSGPQTRCRIWL